MVLQFKFPNLYMHHVDNILLQFCHIYDSSLVPNVPLLLRLLVATVKPICKPFHVPCHRHRHSRLNHQHRCPRQADRQTDGRPFETALKYLTSPFSQRVTVSTVGACFFLFLLVYDDAVDGYYLTFITHNSTHRSRLK